MANNTSAVEAREVLSFGALDTKSISDAGVEVEIFLASGDSFGMFITVLGTDSAIYQRVSDRNDRNRLKQMAKSGRNLAIDSIMDQTKAQNYDLTAECTIAWRHESKALPFDVADKEKLVDFYKAFPLAFDQVRVAMNDRSLFTKVSASN